MSKKIEWAWTTLKALVARLAKLLPVIIAVVPFFTQATLAKR